MIDGVDMSIEYNFFFHSTYINGPSTKGTNRSSGSSSGSQSTKKNQKKRRKWRDWEGKTYLHDNCDYSFTTLQENMPNALASVSVETIRKWEHRMQRWMKAYRDGLGVKDAQIQVKTFSSKHYKSHRRVPEHVAVALDA